MPSLRTRRSARARKLLGASIQQLEPRRLLCGLPHDQLITPPQWSAEVEERYAEPQDARGGTRAVGIVWSNRGLASDGFAAAFGTSANAGRAVVDAVFTQWGRIIQSFNRSDGTSTLQVNLSIGSAFNFGAAAAPEAVPPADRKPRTGSITINRGSNTPDVNDSNGWFFDPTPMDNAEFMGTINNAYNARATNTSQGADFFSVVALELAHVLGMISDKGDTAGAWQLYSIEDFSVDTGIRDNAEGSNAFGNFYVFDGPNIDHLMTSYNSGDATTASWGNVIHTSGGGNITYNGVNYRGIQDDSNALYDGAERVMPSFVVARILGDAYGYTINDPEQFATAHTVLNQSTGMLTVRGSSSATSSDLLVVDTQGSDFVITVDIGEDVPGSGHLPGAGNLDGYVTRVPISSVNSIVVNGGGGTDFIRIERNAGKSTSVNGEDGDDFIDFGFGTRNLGNITGNTNVNGGNGSDQIFVYDNATAVAQTYTITSARFDRPGWGGFAYASDVEFENLTTGTGADTVNVQSTFANQPVWIWNAAGTDTVNIGNTSNGIRSINSNVTVHNDPSFTTLNINNGPDTGARSWSVDAVNNFGYIVGMAPANIYWDNADIGAINLTCGSGVDTGQFVLSSETFNVNNAGANDFIRIGVPAAAGLQGITGQITIDNGPAFTTLTIDDTGSAIIRNVTIDEAGGYNTISGLAPALLRFDSVDTESTKIITGSSNDTINVPRNDDTLILSSSGSSDTVNLGNTTNGVQSIVGSVRVMNPPSFTTININDGPNTVARTPILDNVTFEGALYGSWSQLAPALIEYKYGDLAAVNITFGSASDVITIRKSQGVLNLTTTGGTDAYTIGGSSDGAQSVLGEITVLNPPSHNTINVNDAGNTLGRTAILDDTLVAGLPYGLLTGLAPANILWKYNDTTDVNITHGSGADSLAVKRHQKLLTIQGTAGADVVTLGGVAGVGMNGVTAATTVLNTGGATTLVLDDAADAAVNSVQHDMTSVTNGRVSGMSPSTVDYRVGQVSRVRLRTGTAANSVTVTESAATSLVYYDPASSTTGVFVNGDGVGAAALYTDRSVSMAFLQIGNSGAFNQTLGGFALRTNTLSMSPNSRVDLSDGDMILDYTGASQLNAVRTLINNGRAGGAWTGFGITSSAAKNANPKNTTLGLMEASEFKSIYGPAATFAGQAIDTTAVVVKYTYYGDADFNGVVNFDDYSRADAGFNFGRSGWLNGDFDGNGSVNFDDYSLIDLAFNTQGSPLRPSIGDSDGKGAHDGLR